MMRKNPGVVILCKALVGLLISFLWVAEASARNDELYKPIQDVLTEYEDRLSDSVKLYFGDQPHGKVTNRYGEFPTSKKTNAFRKTSDEACQWVMLSALLSLQERAQREGGNAVINIRSYYDKKIYSSTTDYECHMGNIMAGVALIGEVVTLE